MRCLLTVLVRVCVAVWPAAASASSYDATPVPTPASSPQVKYLSDEASGLKRMALDTASRDESVHGWARRIFEQVPEPGVVNVGNYQPGDPWQRQVFDIDPDADRRCGTVDCMMHAFPNTLVDRNVPFEVAENLRAAYQMVQQLRLDGKVDYDSKGMLRKGILAAYAYDPKKKAVMGIMLHEDLRAVSKTLGDTVAALTLVGHEGWHAFEDAMSGLHPAHSVQDEIHAFNNQADALLAWDPKGHRLSRFYALYVEEKYLETNSAKPVPGVIKEVVVHLAGLRAARLRDLEQASDSNMKQFVQNLGYHDRGP